MRFPVRLRVVRPLSGAKASRFSNPFRSRNNSSKSPKWPKGDKSATALLKSNNVLSAVAASNPVRLSTLPVSVADASNTLSEASSSIVKSPSDGLFRARSTAPRRWASANLTAPSSFLMVPVASVPSTLRTTPSGGAGVVSTNRMMNVSLPSGMSSANVSTAIVARVSSAPMVTVPLTSG